MPPYKRRRVEENPERKIALGMIVSKQYLKEIQEIWQPELIQTPFVLTIAGWCLEYFQNHGTAPGVHIEDIFREHVDEGDLQDEEEDLILEFLDSLSEEYERSEHFNADYLLKKSEQYFEKQNLRKKAANVRLLLSQGNVEEAQQEFAQYRPIQRLVSQGIDPFTAKEEMRKAFDYAAQPLFTLPGAAGQFLNELFVPDSFVTLLGPEKRGKTFWLIELSMRARKAGNNVAFFGAGDMTVPQMMMRYGIRFTGRHNKAKYCGELLIPVMDCKWNQDDTCEMKQRKSSFGVLDEKGKICKYEDEPDYIPCTYCRRRRGRGWEGAVWWKKREPVEPLSWNDAVVAGEKLSRRWGKKSRMKLVNYANGTLTVSKLEAELDLWERNDNFIPNVIIVDYMDLFEPDKINGNDQNRHKINEIWKRCRRISQERNCCFISASQSDTLSYTSKWIGMKHFSESKTKNAHVTGMITLNQTPEEKRRGIMRLGSLLTRENEFDETKGVTVLQSLATGRILLDSF